MLSTPRPLSRRWAVLPLLLLGLLLGACTDSGGDGEDEPTPAEVLADAKETLDDTSGLHLVLSTDDLPDGVVGVTGADGSATHDAFDGTLTLRIAGNAVDVPVIAVDDTVYAEVPFTAGWSEVDPADYGAPDPGRLLDPDTGFSALLPQTEDPEAGDSERGGEDNKEVLTTYTGTVPGEAMKDVIPSSSGDSFDATYLITDNGELRQATFTGVFYPQSPEMTYQVDFSDYGAEHDISAP